MRLLFIIAIFLLLSCNSVFEERERCPCFFTLNTSEVVEEVSRLNIWFLDRGGKPIYKDTLYASSMPELYEIEIERDLLSCYVWGNLRTSEISGGGTEAGNLLFTNGSDGASDSLYFYKREFDTRREFHSDTIRLKKEYANVYLHFKNATPQITAYRPSLKCSTSGRYLNGEFYQKGVEVSGELCRVDGREPFCYYRIGRQEEFESLELSVSADHSIALGRLLISGGYDFESENMEDIEILIDWSSGSFSIKVEDWSIAGNIEIEI